MQRRRQDQVTYITHFRVTLGESYPVLLLPILQVQIQIRHYCHFQLDTYDDIRHTLINLEMLSLTTHTAPRTSTATGTLTGISAGTSTLRLPLPATGTSTTTTTTTTTRYRCLYLVPLPVQVQVPLHTSATLLWLRSNYGGTS
jgi:hypothetical protein